MLNFFVISNGDGSYTLSVAGVIAVAVLFFLLLVFISAINSKKKNKNEFAVKINKFISIKKKQTNGESY